MDVSFVLPARNAAVFLPQTLPAIHIAARLTGLSYEVLVVDHGSGDSTAACARSHGAVVVDGAGLATVGAVRNVGAGHAAGAVLVFVDADVALGEEWASGFVSIYNRIRANERILAGSEVRCPLSDAWILRVWFDVNGKDTHYLNSAHLIIDAGAFRQLAGFSETLLSGEDYDLSRRARVAGMVICADPQLTAYHLGYPRKLMSFFVRELWHGIGDGQLVASGSPSRVGWVALVLAVATLAGAAFSLLFSDPRWLVAPGLLLAAAAAGAAARRPKRHWAHVVPVCALYIVYLSARALAIPWALLIGMTRRSAR